MPDSAPLSTVVPQVTTGAFPSSRKIYAAGKRHGDLRVAMREIEGLSTTETAECLDVSDDVVKTRLSRARAALRRDLFDRAGLAAFNAFTFQRPRCDRVVAAVLVRIG